MGTPIPRPHPPDHGEPCVFCEDLVWGAARTPKTVTVVFHGIIPELGMPPPPNGLPLLLQQGLDPFCGWSGLVGDGTNDWMTWYDSRTSEIQMELWTGGHFLYFTGTGPPCMGGPHHNAIIPGTAYGHSGNGYVLGLPLEYVYKVADVYGIAPDPRGLYDDQPASDPAKRVVRIANRTFGGSIQILLEPGAM